MKLFAIVRQQISVHLLLENYVNTKQKVKENVLLSPLINCIQFSGRDREKEFLSVNRKEEK
jgi:hypothetical protein